MNKALDKLKHKKEAGFTLFELLISLSLSSMILMAVLSSLSDFLRARNRVLFNNRLLSSSELVFGTLSNDLHSAKTVDIEFQQIKIVSLENDSFIYQVNPDDFRIYRNEEPLTPANIKVNSFSVISRGKNPELPLVEITIDSESEDNRIQRIATSKRTTISVRANKFGGTP